ncbi:putative glycolipid-binding domain-containing protein [Streptomyces sp. NPDC014806]
MRYSSGSFRSDLEIDADGFVVHYPQLATRIAAQ